MGQRPACKIFNVCGLYQRRSDKQKIAEAFALGNVDGLALDLAPDYNVAPTTMQPIDRKLLTERRLAEPVELQPRNL